MIRDFFSKPPEPAPEESQLTCRLTTELLRPADQSWRIFSIMSEFVGGFNLLKKLGPSITFWGSARIRPGDKFYNEAEQLASIMSERGLVVVTGGGKGVMEAGNVGAFKVGGESIGFNIRLPEEQTLNSYTTESITFDHFFARKVMLAYASEVYVFFPGGFGTLDEFFEIITLIQTKKITAVPVLLYGRAFWEPLVSWMRQELFQRYATISESDMDIFHIVDSVEEADAYIVKELSDTCNLRPIRKKGVRRTKSKMVIKKK